MPPRRISAVASMEEEVTSEDTAGDSAPEERMVAEVGTASVMSHKYV